MTTTPSRESATGLICPSCSGVVPVVEGTRIVRCPYCDTHSLIQGDRGIQRWQVRRRIDRAAAEAAMREFLVGIRKARDLRRLAQTSEIILAYLPFWRVDATVAGWLFGRVKSGDDNTKPAEFSIFEHMHWNDAALDVGDLAIHRIAIDDDELEPFDSQTLHAEGMVFEPTESATEALDEARRNFVFDVQLRAKQTSTYYQNIQLLSPILTLAYYPVWLVRYTYRQRTYQVVVDAVTGTVVAGKAPGNTLYRAAALVSALAAGTFVLVNGSILVLAASFGDDDIFGLVLLPVIVGLLLILWGYRSFRFGEEVEDRHGAYLKLGPDVDTGLMETLLGEHEWNQMLASGTAAVEDLARLRSEEARRHMKLLALRCPHCAVALAPREADVVLCCPNCRSAVLLAEGGLTVADARYAAPGPTSPEAWVPLWGFEGQVQIERREAQNKKVSLTGWVSTHESQTFWSQANRTFIPAWDVDLPQASEIARNLLESQPDFRQADPPDGILFQPAVISPDDARKLLELVVVTVEARRSDWLKELDFTLAMGPPQLWILPAHQKDGRWQLLAENTRR